jgi:hypothetical protein
MGTLVTLDEVRGALGELYEPAEAEAWLMLPNDALDGEVPFALIAAGRGDEVLRIVRAILDGTYT